MRAPGRLPVAGLVSGRPLPSPRLVPTGRVTTLGEARQEASPRREPTGVSLLVVSLSFLGCQVIRAIAVRGKFCLKLCLRPELSYYQIRPISDI